MLKKILLSLGFPTRLLMIWIVFFASLWLSNGVGAGYPAFAICLVFAGALWWRWSKQRSHRAQIVHAVATVLALLPLAYLLVPLASSSLAPLPANPAIQFWPTSSGRSVAVYHYAPAVDVPDRGRTLLFVHGGPGGYVRNFDRDFLASFARDGFEVLLYDQFGAGESPLGKPSDYTHDQNVADLKAVLARLHKPIVLVGQSYGATLVTSALADPDVQRRISHLVLTEPGRIPGARFSHAPAMSEKTTRAPDAGAPPSTAIALKLAAPRALVATMLPVDQHFASQEELINHYSPEVQRALISSSFCKGDRQLLDSFQATRFNPLVNSAIMRLTHDSPTPKLQNMGAPVLLLLGECSYIPRGRAMEYFDVYKIARSHLIPGVGHILWGNAKGQALTREAITRFVDQQSGPLPNEPSPATRDQFVAAGR